MRPPERFTRRTVLTRTAVGLTGGAIASLLAACTSAGPSISAPTSAPAAAPTSPPAAAATSKPAAAAPTTAAAAAPTTAPAAAGGARGSGAPLKILMWQGPTILNVHLAQGTKDTIASRFGMEPLMTVGADGSFSPVLAAEVPSKDNGGLGADGQTVTYKLKPGIKWADGQPFTADDVVFTYQYISNPDTAATTLGNYVDLASVEAVDPMTVRLTFKAPTGGWYVPFVGSAGQILPKHALEQYVGAASRDAPFNLKSFGTGPYMVQDFRPGDSLTLVPNPNYRDPGKPFFSEIDIKGGGDAPSAARAVLQTGEYDYGWNLQVEAQVLNGLIQGGKGELVTGPGGGVEQILLNQADPNTEVDGERASLKSKHPFLTDIKVRQAMALAIDRDTMARQLYGPTGNATANVLTTPTNLASKSTTMEFNIDKANQILDQAGYTRGGDGIRMTPSGMRMHVVYQTTINSLRQKEQDIVKAGWQQIGIETELKSVDASVFFSADAGNPDTNSHFYTDVEMYTTTFGSPFPLNYMKSFYSGNPDTDVAQQSNKWAGRNYTRWINADYNNLLDQVKAETDVQKAQQLWMQLNDLAVNNYIPIPLIDRNNADGKLKTLQGPSLSPFDDLSWNIADWSRTG
ncbi:MAG: peptide ABC transporter substrate-binding protein [Chloroflexi bacterium]|nr:peptide ABC transporter substrate-binding protein [Chloroflexota bacterium]MBV9600642.1 peptide ABC transporter substrate-binding protein [Chloroflexota bacterium]